MSATDLQKRLTERPESAAGFSRTGIAPTPEIKGILQNITALISDADRRHDEALRHMQARVANLGRDASSIRPLVPNEFAPSFERIEDGLTQIASRISRGHSDRTAAREAAEASSGISEFAAEQAESGLHTDALTEHALAKMQAALIDELPMPTPAHATRPAADEHIDAPWRSDLHWARSGLASEAAGTDGMLNRDVDDQPWDPASAEALTSACESAAGVDYDHAATPADTEHRPSHRAQSRSFATASDFPSGLAQPQAAPAIPALGAADGIEREWLEERFAEIANRIEQSLAELHANDATAALDSRLEQLETHFSHMLDGVATRADFEDLKHFGTHLDTLVEQVEQAQLQLQRLDTIEAQLSEVTEKLSEQRLSALLQQFAPTQDDAKRIADAAAAQACEQAARQFASLASATATQPDKSRQLAELHDLLDAFMAERRQGEEQTAGVLDSLQQAMVQLLDRVDAIEVAPKPTDVAIDLDDAPQPLEFEQEPAPDLRHDTGATAQRYPIDAEKPVPAYVDPGHPAADTANQPAPWPEATYARPEPEAEPALRRPPQPKPSYVTPEPIAEAPYHPPGADWQNAPAPDDASRAEQQPAAYAAGPVAAERQQVQPQLVVPPAAMPQVYSEPQDSENDRPKVRAEMSREQLIAEARRAMQVAAAKREAQEQAKALANKNKSKMGKLTRYILMGTFVLVLLSAALFFLLPKTPAASGPDAIQTGPSDKQSYHSGQGLPAPDTSVASTDDAPEISAPQDRAEIHEINGSQQAFPGIILNRNPQITMLDASRLRERQRLAELNARLGQSQIEAQQEFGAVAIALPLVKATTTTRDQNEADPDAEARSVPVEMPPFTIGPASLRHAAAKGDPSAQFEVAVRFAEGKGIQQDLAQAVRWFQRSASQGNATAQYRLATHYERGLGVKADIARARIWYQRAADAGHIKAMHNLAVLSAGREGNSADYATAARWFTLAAEHGLADSQFNLAILSEGGIGMKKDVLQAYKWFSIASRAGDREALRRMNLLRGKLSGTEIASAENLAAGFNPKPYSPMINDTHMAGEAWKTRAQLDTAG